MTVFISLLHVITRSLPLKDIHNPNGSHHAAHKSLRINQRKNMCFTVWMCHEYHKYHLLHRWLHRFFPNRRHTTHAEQEEWEADFFMNVCMHAHNNRINKVATASLSLAATNERTDGKVVGATAARSIDIWEDATVRVSGLFGALVRLWRDSQVLDGIGLRGEVLRRDFCCCT